MTGASVIRRDFNAARAGLAAAQAYIDELEFAVEQLSVAIAAPDAVDRLRRVFGLSPDEARFVTALAAGESVSRDRVYAALYGARAGDGPNASILTVHVCRIRNKLHAAGISIETVWGIGWRLSPVARAEIKRIVAGGEPEWRAVTGRPPSRRVSSRGAAA